MTKLAAATRVRPCGAAVLALALVSASTASAAAITATKETDRDTSRLEKAPEFRGLLAVGDAAGIPPGTVEWAPAGSRARGARAAAFTPDFAGDYVVASDDGARRERWTAVAFPADGGEVAVGEAAPFVDTFRNGDVAHSDAVHLAWAPSGSATSATVAESLERGLTLSGAGAAMATRGSVLNALRWPSEVVATGVRVAGGGTLTLAVSAVGAGEGWRLAVAVSAGGRVTPTEWPSGGGASAVKAVSQQHRLLPHSRCDAVDVRLVVDSVGYSLSVACPSEAAGGQRARADRWANNTNNAIVAATGTFSSDHLRRLPRWRGSCRVDVSLAGGDGADSKQPTAALRSLAARPLRRGANAAAGAGAGAASRPPLPVVLGPVVNGVELGDGGLGPAQPLASRGYLDATKPPFSADPTGAADATRALQRALDFGRQAYLTTLLPSGTYTVSATLNMTEPGKMFLTTVGAPYCNNMAEVFGAKNRTQIEHCSRTAPAELQGSRVGRRPVIVLAKGTRLSGPVVRMHNPINENINMNQVISHVDIHIEDGNPSAQGVYARAAQGTSVQDVTIYAGAAACGLVGGAGSGGSHVNVTVIGGRVGMDLSEAQPAPTLVDVTLVGQTGPAIVYGTASAKGRQTLSVVGATIVRGPGSAGPAIQAIAPLSIADSVIDGGGGDGDGAAAAAVQSSGPTYLTGVYVRGFESVLDAGDEDPVLPPGGASVWTRVGELASSGPFSPASATPIFVNGTALASPRVQSDVSADPAGPPAGLTAQHSWGATFPFFQTVPCDVTDEAYGAKGDYVTDDTAALQKALDDPRCAAGVFVPKGYYAVTATLRLPTAAVLVGAGRIYTSIVPHASVAPTLAAGRGADAWPLVETGAGAGSSATVCGLSVIVWHHVNATFAVRWLASAGVWREAHTNRVDVDPGVVGPPARYDRPLNTIEGDAAGAMFYNFYQENWEYQGAAYRHLRVTGGGGGKSSSSSSSSSSGSKDAAAKQNNSLRFYHMNTEHSQGEANSEFRDVAQPVFVYGFKGEGNYVQLWFSNCTSFVLVLGYGGNASPFPFDCPYPPGYAPYRPSLIRLERVPNCRVANLMTQTSRSGGESRCGVFNTGFAGMFYSPSAWRSVFEVAPSGNYSTPPLQWPTLYSRGRRLAGAEHPALSTR